jgi:DNA-binding NtrC family response regulator
MRDAVGDDGRRILVVEDNEDFRDLMELTLRDEGYDVDAASCAEDAVRLLNTRAYQLVLSDYSLPAHSGAWLLSKATERVNGREVPFVIITGDPDAPGIPHDAVVIRKPVDFDRLLVELRRMLAAVRKPAHVGVCTQRHQPHHSVSNPSFIPATSA